MQTDGQTHCERKESLADSSIHAGNIHFAEV